MQRPRSYSLAGDGGSLCAFQSRAASSSGQPDFRRRRRYHAIGRRSSLIARTFAETREGYLMNRWIRRSLIAAVLCMFILPLAVSAQTTPDDNTIVVAQSVDISSFDPSAAASRTDTNILGHIFATLYEVDDGGKF